MEPAGRDSEGMSKAKILVVDDDPNFSRLLAVILDHVGAYEAHEENCPSKVMETAREFRPRLIVLNVNMDEKDGTAISSEIRSDRALSKIPIIFVTEPISKKGHEVPKGVLSVSKSVTPRHFLNVVRAACPQFDQETAASRISVSASVSRGTPAVASRKGSAAA
jgi:DNA-binding response OmpR family regulator